MLTHLYGYWLNLILAEESQMNQTSETPETRQREAPNDLNMLVQGVRSNHMSKFNAQDLIAHNMCSPNLFEGKPAAI